MAVACSEALVLGKDWYCPQRQIWLVSAQSVTSCILPVFLE